MKESVNKYKSTVKIKYMSYEVLLCLCMMVMMSSSMNFQELSVSAQSYIINTVTKYTILYDRTQENFGIGIDVNNFPIPAGSNMTLTVPSVYNIGNIVV